MYGLVNKAIKDLVTTNFGDDKWQLIAKKADLQVEEFIPLDTYDDVITYSLVGAASEVLQLSPGDVLRAFGKYWVTFTAVEGYGELMDLFGQNFDDCISNLNQMHSRMGAMMPSLKPPKFVVTSNEKNVMQVEYYSTRPGLAPMVQGLLEGLAEKHSEKITVIYTNRKQQNEPDLFTIEKVA